MTTKDKTGDRLVASIRRTKAGADGKGEAATSSRRPPREAEKPAQAPAKPARTRSTARKKAAPKPGDTGGNYASGRRVWPD